MLMSVSYCIQRSNLHKGMFRTEKQLLYTMAPPTPSSFPWVPAVSSSQKYNQLFFEKEFAVVLPALSSGIAHGRRQTKKLISHHIKTQVSSPLQAPKIKKGLLRHQNYTYPLVCTTAGIFFPAVSRDI